MTQTRTVKLDDFRGYEINLPYGPIQSVTSVVYLDEDDTSQTVDSGDYTLDAQSRMAKIRVTDNWPSTNRSLNNVVVTYVAGADDALNVPEEAKLGVKKVISRLYENRGDNDSGSVLTAEIMDVLDPIKVYWNAEY
jgi:uncharacterized phiE125 gp8 family phage protein